MLTGVPQPSVLEPLLSLIHNDGFNDNITVTYLNLQTQKCLEGLKMKVINNIYKTIYTNYLNCVRNGR